ncbi:importin-4 isoform X1 [Scophthalmus maximus]|uniref:Importin 4 n=2 Tax=Scophthalmus maximus TaxID=52904 RepID=A0A8D3BDL3_SCOMX|nr:importin-4 isoform X1 [Scophthalmus maximus]XP_047185744.1 importin-4 isoform X1 [Scophthalmus maximus]
MTEELERILLQLTQPDNEVIQQATAQLKQAFKDPAIIPALCVVMSGSQNPQIRQSAAVMLRLRVKKHWSKITPSDRESLKGVVLQAFMQETEHTVQHSLSQLCAVMVKHETPDRWPALLEFLNQSTKSDNPHDRQVGLLLLNKVMDSNPEPFKPHYCQLLQLFSAVLQDHNNPTALYYCILTLTAITAYTGTEEMNQMRSIIPSLIVALKQLIKADQDQASEAMEVFNELMESEVSIIVPHVAEIVRFFLEVGSDATLSDSLRVKALSCITFLIKLKSKTVLKQKLLNPILQAIFPVLVAAPPPGEQDPEDDEDDSGDSADNDNPKHCAAQIIDTMALHMPPEKLFQQLMPLTQACLASDNPYQRKGGLLCLAVLAEGCADHIRTKMLSQMLQAVCQSLSDSNQVVRCAGLFALGQFSEHLQPEVSKYCTELMPLLLGYLSSLNQAKVGHVTKAFYALENFLENLGPDIEPYLPTLMDTMFSALNNTENLKIRELAVSAIGAIANAAKELLVPYFPPVIESLKGFLTATTEEMRSLQTQSLDTLSVLARTIGKDVFGPLAAECVQLGLNLTDTIDDPDLRRCTYSLYSAVSTVSPDCLTPHLTAITTVMLLALKSNEGITAHLEEDKTFVLLDDDNEDDKEEVDLEDFPEDEAEVEADIHDVAGFSVENAFIDEKEDACDALGEIAFNTGAVFQVFLESSFQQVYEMRDFPHEDVRRAAFGAMGQFCRAQHKVWKENPSEVNHQALLKLLDLVLPCFVETVRAEQERQVVMAILETMNNVIKSCKEEVFRDPSRLKQISYVIRDVLKKKTVCQDGGADEADDEDQQAEYDAMLQEFAGEGIPLLASSVPADSFAPFLNDLLPLIMSKAKSSCTVAERSFSVGTIGEILQSLASVSGGRGVAGRLSNRLLPVLVAGVRDSDAEVRNNSVFGLGCMAQAAGPIVVSDYPMMLSVFSNMLTKESDLRVIDNLCAALCRMILSNIDAVPLEQVVPALVDRLPLKEDLEENKTVFSCLALLYTHSPALIVKLMKPIVAASSHALGNKNVDEEAQCTAATLMREFAQRHSTDFQSAVMSLAGEQQAKLSAVISAS